MYLEVHKVLAWDYWKVGSQAWGLAEVWRGLLYQ